MDTLKRLKLFQKTRAEVKDPQAECDGIVLYLNTSGRKFLGMDVLSLDFSFVNPRYIFLLTMMISFLYADLEAAVLADDIGGFAYNIAVLGFGLQGFAKFDAYVYRKKFMHDLVWQCSAFLGKNKGHDRFSTFLVDNVAVIMIVSKFYYRLYGLVFFTCATFGILQSVMSGERLLSFGFQFSFLDTNNWVGFTLTYCYQVINSLMVVISSCCNDILIAIVYVNAMSMYDCIMSDLRELSKISEMEKTQDNKRLAEEQMKSIIQQHQHLMQFLDLSNDVYSSYFLMSLASMTGTIAVLLTALVMVRWYPAIVICFAASFQIFTLSLLGTLLLIKGEELIQQVYDINWYNLDLPVQKSLKLLLLISQNNKEISYRFGVMNMETFVQSHKLVYSFFTMLVTTKE
ncbi:odorant receptor 49b-like [Aedes albopictus]|uniref:Odorant receptor n=1 Tax=Aedes albopictus TaxID=7160 RepID=A0ABM1Y8W0_AEDAL|nr:odorant receptor 49b-like [Aedes albopictus]